MKVAIRVDASHAIGTGHVRRCLSLAHALTGCGTDVLFVTRDLGVDAPGMIVPFAARQLPAPIEEAPVSRVPHADWAQVSAAQDVRDTVAALGDWRPDWLVIDSYAFDAEWHAAARAALDCRIAVVDDLADRALAADLVVDHNYHADHSTKYSGRIKRSTVLLGGPRFALLGPAFAGAERYAPKSTVESIGIFLGGIDQGNFSALALQAIDASGFHGPVEIVSTSANPNLTALRAAVEQRPNTQLSIDLPDLAAFFAEHDIQIGAAGGATWERCCIGAPTVLLVVAENQNSVLPLLVAEGVVAAADSLECSDIARAISSLIGDSDTRALYAAKARALVDGLGAQRVAKKMIEINED